MRYAFVIEKTDTNYSAYVPDLPGCVAAAATVREIEKEIREAIRFHVGQPHQAAFERVEAQKNQR